MAHVQVSMIIPASPLDSFALLTDPSRIHSLLKDSIEAQVVNPLTELGRGAELKLAMQRFGVSSDVRVKVDQWIPRSRWSYRVLEGPFSRWIHLEKFEAHGDRQTLVTDIVDYELPLGLLGRLADDLWFRADLTRILRGRLERAVEYFTVASSDNQPELEYAQEDEAPRG